MVSNSLNGRQSILKIFSGWKILLNEDTEIGFLHFLDVPEFYIHSGLMQHFRHSDHHMVVGCFHY